MRLPSIILIPFFALIIVCSVACAEQLDDVSVAVIRLNKKAHLDKKTRKEIATAAAKIKKQGKAGVVKLRGNSPSTADPEEYLSKSVFMARDVEKYLRTLLPNKFQIFIVASDFKNAAKTTDNSVEILLYPHQLQLEELEALRYVSSRPNPMPKPSPESEPLPTTMSSETQTTAPAEVTVTGYTTSKKEQQERDSEDPAAADELVRRAKARALENAKKRAGGN